MGIETGLLIGGLALSAAGAGMAYASNKQAAANAQAIANYNASLDKQQAAINESTASRNLLRMSQQKDEYLSKMRSAYAAAGLLDTGSPLMAEASAEGRLRTEMQDYWNDTQTKSELLYQAAAAGVWEGGLQASQYNMQAYSSLINGGASMSKMAMSYYK